MDFITRAEWVHRFQLELPGVGGMPSDVNGARNLSALPGIQPFQLGMQFQTPNRHQLLQQQQQQQQQLQQQINIRQQLLLQQQQQQMLANGFQLNLKAQSANTNYHPHILAAVRSPDSGFIPSMTSPPGGERPSGEAGDDNGCCQAVGTAPPVTSLLISERTTTRKMANFSIESLLGKSSDAKSNNTSDVELQLGDKKHGAKSHFGDVSPVRSRLIASRFLSAEGLGGSGRGGAGGSDDDPFVELYDLRKYRERLQSCASWRD